MTDQTVESRPGSSTLNGQLSIMVDRCGQASIDFLQRVEEVEPHNSCASGLGCVHVQEGHNVTAIPA